MRGDVTSCWHQGTGSKNISDPNPGPWTFLRIIDTLKCFFSYLGRKARNANILSGNSRSFGLMGLLDVEGSEAGKLSATRPKLCGEKYLGSLLCECGINNHTPYPPKFSPFPGRRSQDSDPDTKQAHSNQRISRRRLETRYPNRSVLLRRISYLSCLKQSGCMWLCAVREPLVPNGRLAANGSNRSRWP